MPNLVTRLTFIPTAERLPDKAGDYLCINSCSYITTLNFNTIHNMFNVSDDDVKTAITPLAWAKIPASFKDFVKELKGDDD